MSNSKVFSGPPSNKATAATIAAATATLFWTIAAHTFWKHMSSSDMTLYITTSTVFLTAIISFRVPESAAYTTGGRGAAGRRRQTSARRHSARRRRCPGSS